MPESLKGEKWIIYAIEGNSRFNKDLKLMKEELTKRGHTVILFGETIAGTRNGHVTFFIDQKNKHNNNKSWGSSVFQSHPDITLVGSSFPKRLLVINFFLI